jgi:hypothetical protein
VVVAAAEAAMTDVKVVADTKDAVAKAEAVEEEFVAKDSMKMVKSLMELKPVATVKATREKLVKTLTQWTDIPELAVERETIADKEAAPDGVMMPTRSQLLKKANKKRPKEEMTRHLTPVKDANAVPKRERRLSRKSQRKKSDSLLMTLKPKERLPTCLKPREDSTRKPTTRTSKRTRMARSVFSSSTTS